MKLYNAQQVQNAQTAIYHASNAVHKARQVLDKGAQPWIRFDLDECVLDSQPRTAAIVEHAIDELIADPELKNRAQRRLKSACDRRTIPYLVADLWQEIAGSEGAPFKHAIVDAWFQRFFMNEWLSHDVPYPKVGAFFDGLQDATRAPIGALTGRHEANPESKFPRGMRHGTVEALKTHKLPWDAVHMKDNFSTNDLAFKRGAFGDMITEGRPPVVYIDNEPSIVNAHRDVMHQRRIPALSIFRHTSHKEDVRLHPDVLVLTSFSLD